MHVGHNSSVWKNKVRIQILFEKMVIIQVFGRIRLEFQYLKKKKGTIPVFGRNKGRIPMFGRIR